MQPAARLRRVWHSWVDSTGWQDFFHQGTGFALMSPSKLNSGENIMHRPTLRPAQLLLIAMSSVFSMEGQAATTLYAVGGGWFSNTGEHIEFNSNYAVGGGADGYIRNNYFLFDTSGMSGPISSATLRVYNPSAPVSPGFPFGYTSADPSETYALFDVSTAFFSNILPGGNRVAGYGIGSASGQTIFNDLGSGQSFGTYTASLADNGRYVAINMNTAGLAALNASSGIFAVGGAITTLDNVVNKESLFASGYLDFQTPSGAYLVISSVPEPSGSLLFIAGLGLVGLAARRRARKEMTHL